MFIYAPPLDSEKVRIYEAYQNYTYNIMESKQLEEYNQAVLAQPQKCKSHKTVNSYINDNMTQVLTYPQQMNNLCGFHAISAIMTFDKNDLTKLQDKSIFVDNYYLIREYLIKHTTNPKNIGELKNYGEMQRIQIDMLIEKKEEFAPLKGKNIADFTYGFNYIQNSEESLQNLEKVMKDFKNKTIDRVYILLGITVHWSLLVIDNPSHPHFYYIDSMNYPLSSILTNPTHPDKQLQSYFKDLTSSLKILTDMVLRQVDLPLIKFQNQLSQMLLSWANLVDISNQQQIKKWFIDEYHPMVIKNDVFQPMGKCELKKVNPILLKEFGNWLGLVEKYGVFQVREVREKVREAVGK